LFLRGFREFLRDTRKIKRSGHYSLAEFEELLTIFVHTKNDIVEVSSLDGLSKIDYVRKFLRNNGIIRELRQAGGRYINYQVPFLYKYHLLYPNA
jgi:hypothetical protein